MENNFTHEIKEFLIDRLADFCGYEKPICPEDLYDLLTDDINMSGSVHCSSYLALKFIGENIFAFDELCAYLSSSCEIDLNPIRDPERAEVIAYIEGVRYLLGRLESLEKAVDASEFYTIILSDDLIAQMVEELENNSFEITF